MVVSTQKYKHWNAAQQVRLPHVDPHLFTHVDEEGVLQRTELQRSIGVGGGPPGRPGAMALAIHADAGAKVNF